MKELRAQSSRRAFTLVELVLAISIASVLLVVAIYFNHQCANLRSQLIVEAEKLSTIRLLLQKMTSDLRGADAGVPYGFTGASNSISFPMSESLTVARWSTVHVSTGSSSGLLQVSYRLNTGLEGTNVVTLGLIRDERPLGQSAPTTPELSAEGETTNSLETFATPAEVNELAAITNLLQQPLTELVQGLEFRFWTGAEWTNSWGDISPPRGVEITLSTEPADETDPTAPRELFRRAVFLPAGRSSAMGTNDMITVGMNRRMNR